jgi:hypothetical protein
MEKALGVKVSDGIGIKDKFGSTDERLKYIKMLVEKYGLNEEMLMKHKGQPRYLMMLEAIEKQKKEEKI